MKYLSLVLLDSPDWIKQYLLQTNPLKQLCNVVGFFRSDVEYADATGDENKHLLFVLVDINGEYVPRTKQYKSIEQGRRNFKQFLKLFRSNKKWGYYDYPYQDLYHSHRHVFVINIEQWHEAIDRFDEGLYSKMFTELNLKKFNVPKMKEGKPNSLYQTFKADKEAKHLFKTRVEKEFGTILQDEDVKGVVELDIPPVKSCEILNWK